MFGGATLLAIASSHQAAPGKATLGVLAALGAGVLWGTMYIPYRKAYLTGMNPLSFITFFTIGELATMTVLAIGYCGATPLWHELTSARARAVLADAGRLRLGHRRLVPARDPGLCWQRKHWQCEQEPSSLAALGMTLGFSPRNT